MNWQDQLAVCLIESLWECCAVAAAVVLLEVIVRPQSARSRYWLNFTGLVAMVVWPAQSLFRVSERLPAAVLPLPATLGGPLAQEFKTLDLHQLLVWVWFAGVIILSVRWLIGYLDILSEKRHGLESPELSSLFAAACRRVKAGNRARLLISRNIGVGVAGWLRPVVFVPASALTGLDRTQLEAILYHELAHIQRHDYLFNVLQTVIDTLLFFHPAEWWISRRVRQEREYCCDDLASCWCGDSGTYAKALLALQQSRQGWMPAATGGSLRRRIFRILGRTDMQGTKTFAGLGSVIAAALLVVAMLHAAPPQTESKAGAYTKWLEQDVVYIIAPEERAAFLKLHSDPEKDEFIRQFWARRGEAVKKEHYRRIEYANQRFTSASKPGWATERGKTYIVKGPPDEIESHPKRHTELWLYHSSPSGPITFTTE